MINELDRMEESDHGLTIDTILTFSWRVKNHKNLSQDN